MTIQNLHQNVGTTTIADRLRTVSWNNDSNPTGVVTLVNLRDPNLPTNGQKMCYQKETHLKTCKQSYTEPQKKRYKKVYCIIL